MEEAGSWNVLSYTRYASFILSLSKVTPTPPPDAVTWEFIIYL